MEEKIKPEDFKRAYSGFITNIEEYKDRIILFYKQYTTQKVPKKFVFERPYLDDDDIGTDFCLNIESRVGAVYIECSYFQIPEEVNRIGLNNIIFNLEVIESDRKRELKNKKNDLKRKQLLVTLKVGDIVKRYGKTPNNHLELVKVDKINDNGISGFYVYDKEHDYERTNIYTSFSFDTIQKIVETNMEENN